MMNRDDAYQILTSMTKSSSLLRHARTVELVMRALARKFGEDEELYGITGLLHDADYEMYPDKHPQVIVDMLEEKGYSDMAHAIAGHYTPSGVPRISLMDKCIVAADEITGFIVASALIRPTKIEGMKTKSVMKKFKTATFAASVDRNECRLGAEMIGMQLPDLVSFIIPVLQEHKEELELAAP